LEDPKLTKKLVKRGITELVTPGVAIRDNVLNYKENNFLCAIHFGKAALGLSLIDISTGEYLVDEGNQEYIDKMLANFQPKEVLVERDYRGQLRQMFGDKLCLYEMDDWAFSEQTARQRLHSHFKVKNMKGFGVESLTDGLIAAGAILVYLDQMQQTHLGHITQIRRIDASRYVRLDSFTVRNLELNTPLHEGGTALIDVIDNTISPMGARLLRRWLVFPLRKRQRIEERHDVVDYFFRHPDSRDVIDDELHRVGDMERLVAKVSVGRITPREVVALKGALAAIKPIKVLCTQSDTTVLRRVGENLDPLDELRQHIDHWIVPEPPSMIGKGQVIGQGINQELDELRQIAYSGKDYLLKIQEREIRHTGISSLKIGFNNVFGYYLEVRNTYKDQVPPEWIRKQTLTQAERYITEELKQYEEKIMGAEEKILALENRLFSELIAYLQQFTEPLQRNAHLVAEIDCLLSFARTAVDHHYVRPVVDDSLVIDIRQGRHPVIEANMPIGEQYVPNDVYLSGTSGNAGETGKPGNAGISGKPGDTATSSPQQIIIITGPNMAGKSALLRQTALIVLMAQIGCYVPADSARIGLVDRIFTRVGASDSLSTGESTFMVEMTEAASILNNVTDRSLVLFDELGRGTSTYDGISIAWAIVEYLHEHQGARARTLFATHYHELNEMQNHYPRIKNYNVSVKEIDGKVIFLRRLVEGGSEHSFGIHVAQLAGMPPTIVKRANEVLASLEKEASQVGAAGKKDTRDALNNMTEQGGGAQLSFFQLDDPVLEQIRDEILNADINNLTPLEALNKLSEIKKLVGGK
ncbi:MAG: DNA mismatch repair protein MutS, partial [Prevotella sp.]|nr:DNA mismatch repair protein MutS [Prevotella sp.]